MAGPSDTRSRATIIQSYTIPLKEFHDLAMPPGVNASIVFNDVGSYTHTSNVDDMSALQQKVHPKAIADLTRGNIPKDKIIEALDAKTFKIAANVENRYIIGPACFETMIKDIWSTIIRPPPSLKRSAPAGGATQPTAPPAPPLCQANFDTNMVSILGLDPTLALAPRAPTPPPPPPALDIDIAPPPAAPPVPTMLHDPLHDSPPADPDVPPTLLAAPFVAQPAAPFVAQPAAPFVAQPAAHPVAQPAAPPPALVVPAVHAGHNATLLALMKNMQSSMREMANNAIAANDLSISLLEAAHTRENNT